MRTRTEAHLGAKQHELFARIARLVHRVTPCVVLNLHTGQLARAWGRIRNHLLPRDLPTVGDGGNVRVKVAINLLLFLRSSL